MSNQTIKLVPLGKNGPMVPRLGFGLMGLSFNVYGSFPSDDERFKVLDRAYELGARHWDTSDEELLNKWFQRTGKRDDIFLATKFGFVKGAKNPLEVDSSAEYCKKACAESLKSLGIESIDLYYMHHANPKTPIEETMRALKDLQLEGKIKHIGLSAVSATTLHRAIKIAPLVAVQVEYSISNLDPEGPSGTNLLATCQELGITLVCATPLGRGLLTSTFAERKSFGEGRDIRPGLPQFSGENKEKNVKVVDQLAKIAQRNDCTVSQLALAWLLKQGEHIIPIPGTKKIKYLEENSRALDVVLSAEVEKEIRRVVTDARISGGNLPDAFKHFEYRDTVEDV